MAISNNNFIPLQTYNKTPSMQLYKSTAYMKEASRVLNALYIYNQSYQPFYVLWLFPMQVALADLADNHSTEGNKILFFLLLFIYFKIFNTE